MEQYKEIEGNLITLAEKGNFDVITHGCNCFCKMGSGIAPQMAKAFGCDNFELEWVFYQGNIDKLGRIDYQTKTYTNNYKVTIVNSYIQYNYGSKNGPCLDYEALTLCLRKINKMFAGKTIGLPQIGAGLAGGDWSKIKKIIKQELKDMFITVVIYKP